MSKLQSAETDLTVLTTSTRLTHIDRLLSPAPLRRVVGLTIPSYNETKDPLRLTLPEALMPDMAAISEYSYPVPREIASRVGQFFLRHYTANRLPSPFTRSGCMVVYALVHGIYERSPALPTALIIANEKRADRPQSAVGDVAIFKSPHGLYHCATILTPPVDNDSEPEVLQMSCPGGDLAISTLSQAKENCMLGVFGDIPPNPSEVPDETYLGTLSQTAIHLRCDFQRGAYT